MNLRVVTRGRLAKALAALPGASAIASAAPAAADAAGPGRAFFGLQAWTVPGAEGPGPVRMPATNATPAHLRRFGPLIGLHDLAYFAYAPAVDRSTLRGRIQGLRDRRRYRTMTQRVRRPVELAPARGLRAALGPNAAISTPGPDGRA